MGVALGGLYTWLLLGWVVVEEGERGRVERRRVCGEWRESGGRGGHRCGNERANIGHRQYVDLHSLTTHMLKHLPHTPCLPPTHTTTPSHRQAPTPHIPTLGPRPPPPLTKQNQTNSQEALDRPVEPAHQKHAHCEPVCDQAKAGGAAVALRLHVSNQVVLKYAHTVVHV